MPTSKPVYVAKLSDDGSRVEFHLKDPFKPVALFYGEPLEQLVVDNYCENYNRGTRRFDIAVSKERMHRAIVFFIAEFYENHAPMKNPRQSKIHKWLKSNDADRYHTPFAHGLHALFRYIQNKQLVQSTGTDNPHTANVLAILELMRKKHGEKE